MEKTNVSNVKINNVKKENINKNAIDSNKNNLNKVNNSVKGNSSYNKNNIGKENNSNFKNNQGKNNQSKTNNKNVNLNNKTTANSKVDQTQKSKSREEIIINRKNVNQSKNMINKENINKSKMAVNKENVNQHNDNINKQSSKIANTNNLEQRNTILDQETKIYNFKKDLISEKSKLNEKKNIDENTKADEKINKSNQEIVKEAQKIVNNAVKEEKLNNKEQKEKTENKKKHKGLVVFLIFLIILLIGIIFSTVFGLANMNHNKIIQGVYINNIDVSNLTKEEAISALENKLNNENNSIIVKHNDYSKEIFLKDINGKIDVKDAVNIAYKVGRDNNIVHNNYKTLFTLVAGSNIDIKFNYDEELLQKQIDLISLDLPDLATESSYVIDGNNLIIKNSKSGIQIKKSDFQNCVKNSFCGNEKTFEIPVETCERKEINIEQIYSEVYKAPVDAYYTTNPYAIYKEENGLDFAITLEEAKNMLLEDKEEYTIPLKTVAPKITIAKLDSKAFPNKLGTFTTYYSASDVNRNANIALAAKSITSVVLMPGEVFSYNDLIGECSTRTGYKESTIYLNGELAKGVGGGICQVSTTLYNAVLRANLEIVQRRNHSLSVTYVPLGHDAMVSIGSQDFQFKNNRNYPIKVVATTSATSITCQILGLAEETEYEVKLYSRVISKTETKTKVETYKLLYLNGVEVSRTWLSTDTYKNH